jgi:hypothetical protein
MRSHIYIYIFHIRNKQYTIQTYGEVYVLFHTLISAMDFASRTGRFNAVGTAYPIPIAEVAGWVPVTL